jgi:hypothetical protein
MKSEIEIPIKINASDLGNIEVRQFQHGEFAAVTSLSAQELASVLENGSHRCWDYSQTAWGLLRNQDAPK